MATKTYDDFVKDYEEQFQIITKSLGPNIPHRSRGEIADLRRDMYEAFETLLRHPNIDALFRTKTTRILGSLSSAHDRIKDLELGASTAAAELRRLQTQVIEVRSDKRPEQNTFSVDIQRLQSQVAEARSDKNSRQDILSAELQRLQTQISQAQASGAHSDSNFADLEREVHGFLSTLEGMRGTIASVLYNLREHENGQAELNASLFKTRLTHEALWSNDIELTLGGGSYDVAADDLNAAVADSFKKTFSLQVSTKDGVLVDFLKNLEPVLTPAKSVADGDVGVPVVTGTPALASGAATVEITFDTDAGSTKTYAADDEVSVACDLTVGGYVLDTITATYTVI